MSRREFDVAIGARVISAEGRKIQVGNNTVSNAHTRNIDRLRQKIFYPKTRYIYRSAQIGILLNVIFKMEIELNELLYPSRTKLNITFKVMIT